MSRANFMYWLIAINKAKNGEEMYKHKVDEINLSNLLMGLPTIEEQIEQAMPNYQKLYDLMKKKHLI